MAIDAFFKHKQPAAELKHGILSRYPIIFAAKTGSSASPDQRVVFLDGYAGPGEYTDGEPGSPLLLARQAAALSRTRDVRGVFVEAKPEHVRSLERVLADWRDNFKFRIIEGKLGDKLDEVLPLAHRASLFAFLDPYGSAIGYDQLCAIMHRNKPSRRPPTELLLHFSLKAVYRRNADQLALVKDETKLGKVDRFLGSTDWREIFVEQCRSQRPGLASIVVAEHFAAKVQREQGFRCVPMPVFRSVQAQTPEYLLLLFTRHPEGIWQMANTMSLARKDWAKACSIYRIDAADQRTQLAPLAGLETFHGFDEKRYDKQVMAECLEPIMGNLWRLLDRGPVRIIDHTLEVFGPTLTQAGAPHVRKAVKELFKKRWINDDGKGNDFYKRVIKRVR